MQQSQIDYFNSLSEDNQYILRLAALRAARFSDSDLIAMSTRKPHFSFNQVRACLNDAVKQELVTKQSWDTCFDASPAFMVYIFPSLENLKSEWQKLPQGRFAYHINNNGHRKFRDCLYALLYFDESTYKRVERDYLNHNLSDPANIYATYRLLIEDKNYDHVLGRIDSWLIDAVLSHEIKSALQQLKPLSAFSALRDRIAARIPEKIFCDNWMYQYFFQGQFGKALDALDKDQVEYERLTYAIRGTELLVQGKAMESVNAFERSLTAQRRLLKATYLPAEDFTAFYYVAALLCVLPNKSHPIFQKIKTSGTKESFNPFLAVAFSALNEKELLADALNNHTRIIANIGVDNALSALHVFLVYRLCDLMPNAALFPRIQELIERAFESGFLILACEAAFAFDRMVNTDDSAEFYRRIAAAVPDYTPVLSKIDRQEEWEKVLNLLLGLKPKGRGKNQEEEAMRIVYYFSPQKMSIQPVLQKRQVRGWSKGRNISLKTLVKGSVEGMTDQDIQVIKTIDVRDTYYSSNYEFSTRVFLELVGHPHIFLDGTDDVPVEFIAGKPLVRVTRTDGSYSFKSEALTAVTGTPLDANIFIAKETNTRYKIYNLTQQQQQIITLLQENNVLVPEAGKDKLVEILGNCSAGGMEVHSDIVASASSQTAIKNVSPDSRIRVQLLPFGSGLKAELFSKPFGDRPPYCKPAKGGKALIQNNDDDTQLQVKRDFDREREYENRLMGDIQNLDSIDINNGLMSFNNPMDSLYLLDILNKHLDICVVEWPEGAKYKIHGTAGVGNLNLRVKSGIEWFDLQGELRVDENTVLTLQQLLQLAAQGHGRFIELSPGEFLALSERLKRQLDDLGVFCISDTKAVRINKFASVAMKDFFDEVVDFKTDQPWQEFRQRVDSLPAADIAIPTNLQAELRPYQEEGFRWMARLAAWEGGACLADDMGLGKTIQTLAILLHRAQAGPALVVCPVSVIGNWANEAARFAPSLQIFTLGNTNTNREQTVNNLKAGDVLITSYGLLQSEEELFARTVFATAVLDEAHVIKNYATKTSHATMQLQASFRLALTGTPVQNYLGEIWNLFNFINPGLLGSLKHFTDVFIKVDDENTRKRLKRLIAPFILRRTKNKVLDELPSKTEIVKKITLSDDEAAFYEALRRQAVENLCKEKEKKEGGEEGEGEGDKNIGHIQVLAEITKLRRACCNPRLVDADIQIESSKLAAFIEIVDELIENSHRALVFSQFVTHLSIVSKALDKKGISYQYLDGSTPPAERARRVQEFQEGNDRLFLISLKAGGLGLNLTAADYVIHLDPWWNPSVEDQASDRAHRFGQTRPVTIYRLVAENTIEEKILQLHNTKRDLAESLLEGSDRSARLSVHELMELIKER
ncbi:ATP-dependent helicase HepA [Bacteroidales bacterium Barb6XT]|nr:ATP-dependent helicase HepA [Bacteroidales bacterium Barb6XT]